MPIVPALLHRWLRIVLATLVLALASGVWVFQLYSQGDQKKPIVDIPAPVQVGPQGTKPAQVPTISGERVQPVDAPRVAPTITAKPSDGPPIPVIPTTVVLETGPKSGDGMGPAISVSPAFGRGGRRGLPARNWVDQTKGEADAKSAGCMECHQGVEPMHKSPFVVLGCTDCHGGNPKRGLKIDEAHPKPTYPNFWLTSANPPNVVQIYNHENPEWIRFVNPGDLRIAEISCGLCHMDSIKHVANNLMAHGAHLWGAALYNNGGFPLKTYIFGQAYGRDGAPLKLTSPYKVTPEMTRTKGVVAFLVPLPRYNITQPGNLYRIFEKGGVKPGEIGNPEAHAPNGKQENALSERGLGSRLRTDPTALGAHKTRLNDPLLPFPGTNDHPGDYRASGCTACHTIYANDRSPTNSGWYSKFGNQALSYTGDRAIAKNERGHPISHQFTRTIPSSQCMTCHGHQGNLFVNPYLGYIWWDQESDAEFMYPKKQKNPTEEDLARAVRENPELAAARGLWGDLRFLEKVAELNPKLKHTQFADYHRAGWVFRAIFKKDKKGTLLDPDNNPIRHDDPNKWQKAVHLKDIHLANGMQCVDCHFLQDVHGDGSLFVEARNATSIACIDCHGTISKRPTLIATNSGAAMAGGPVDLNASVTSWGPRFKWEEKADATGIRKVLYQYSAMDPNIRWEVPQTMDSIDPTYTAPYDNDPKYGPVRSHFNPKARYAKTIYRDGVTWGDVPATKQERMQKLAHNHETIECQICHSSWVTSCFGCHLPMRANVLAPQNKFEGTSSRNFVSYNPQTVRDDVFMLGIDGTVKQHKLAVLRASSQVIVGSQNSNREWGYSQQQTISWEGYSGQAFNPHFAHTTSSINTTKNCTDCHMAKDGSNNAWMASLLGYGTGTVNFFGRYLWFGAGEHGIHAVPWTEREEPQAPYGTRFHENAYPDNFREFVGKNHREYKEFYEHHAHDTRDLTVRNEYLYTADGAGGFRIFDIAPIDNKGFSERFASSIVSPIGQNTHVQTKGIATCLALPSTLAMDAGREPVMVNGVAVNEEQPIHKIYGYVFGTDTVEGLVVINILTLFDGNPDNNFLYKDATFNPDGLLNGATYVKSAGDKLFITSPQGLFVVDVHDPLHPRLAGSYRGSFLRNPRAVDVQFHYAFVTDEEGFKVFDVSNLNHPVPLHRSTVRLNDAQRFYVARTYAYVANGKEGLAIIDVERPASPRLFMKYNAGGELNDTRAIQIGGVSASTYGIVADGHNGMRVLSLITPETVPGHMGFTPPPNPRLVGTFHLHHGEALCVSRGADRDRVVDETGGQTVVFGRRGSRPFKVSEAQWFLRHHDDVFTPYQNSVRTGAFYRVDDVKTLSPSGQQQVGDIVTISGRALPTPRDFVDLSRPRDPNAPPDAPLRPAQPKNEFLQPDSVNRMLRLLDPTRPAESGTAPTPPPAVPSASPAPTPPLDPDTPRKIEPKKDDGVIQESAVDRLIRMKDQNKPTPSPSSEPPPAIPAPTVLPPPKR